VRPMLADAPLTTILFSDPEGNILSLHEDLR
jgi:hypothetical protein